MDPERVDEANDVLRIDHPNVAQRINDARRCSLQSGPDLAATALDEASILALSHGMHPTVEKGVPKCRSARGRGAELASLLPQPIIQYGTAPASTSRHYPSVPTRILLVRHCESAVDRLTPPATWGLTERGLRQAKSLVGLTSGPAAIVAGDEPKMLQTLEPLAQALGVEVQGDPALSESHSEGWLGDEEFLEAVRRFLEEPSSSPAPGWETADAAADRFVGRLRQITGDSPQDATVVACSGGRVLTAALHRMNLVPSDGVYSMWRCIGTPDVAEVELENGHPVLRSKFGTRSLDRD